MSCWRTCASSGSDSGWFEADVLWKGNQLTCSRQGGLRGHRTVGGHYRRWWHGDMGDLQSRRSLYSRGTQGLERGLHADGGRELRLLQDCADSLYGVRLRVEHLVGLEQLAISNLGRSVETLDGLIEVARLPTENKMQRSGENGLN